VLYRDSGELGNRLVSYAYLLAFGAEHGVKTHNLCFWRYSHLFEPIARHGGVDTDGDTASKAGFAERLLRGLLKLPCLSVFRRRFEFDGTLVTAPEAVALRALNAAATRLVQTIASVLNRAGWTVREENAWQHQCALLVPRHLEDLPYTDPALVETHADYLRARICIAPPLRQQVTDFVEPLREHYDLLVGVHIRSGDYRHYRKGRWHFPPTTYRRVIEHLTALFKGKRTGFVLASDSSVPLESFAGLPVHVAPGDLAIDLYVLSECHLIVGPPSTFSGWASFIANKPICFLETTDHLPSLDELKTTWTPQFY
jgi:hypothetical protein